MASMRRRMSITLMGLLLVPPGAAQAQPAAQSKPHKVVIQVSDADPVRWNLALNNASNIQQDLGSDRVAIEIVAYESGHRPAQA